MPDPNFHIHAGDSESPCVLHVPHASTQIPADVRRDIVLEDAALEHELRAMTDAQTDVIAARAAELAGTTPWTFENQLSRLVVDPERFPDEREIMESVGMGAVYRRTSAGETLRADDPVRDARLIATYFEPYATALAYLVDERLAATGRAVIVDVHSYPREPLPYELYADEERPEICLGFDDVHTPDWLRTAAFEAFGEWPVEANGPFRGTYVPLRHYGSDRRVSSVMLEYRRDLYVNDAEAVDRLAEATVRLVDAALG